MVTKEDVMAALHTAQDKLKIAEEEADKWVAKALKSPYTWALILGWTVASGAVGAAMFGCWKW